MTAIRGGLAISSGRDTKIYLSKTYKGERRKGIPMGRVPRSTTTRKKREEKGNAPALKKPRKPEPKRERRKEKYFPNHPKGKSRPCHCKFNGENATSRSIQEKKGG